MVQIGSDYVTTSLVYYYDLYLVWSHNKNNCLRKTERQKMKRDMGGGGCYLLTYFLGLEYFQGGLSNFRGGLKNFWGG